MHFLPLLIGAAVLKIALLWACGGPRRFLRFVIDCVSVTEDHWTWTTRTGDWFEGAEIEAIGEGELILKHRYGVVHVAVDALSDNSRDLLYRTEKWAEYLAESADEKIAEFSGRSRARAA
jgi:hypothetical protein